ncbi:sterigmatocystin 8-O-methyltransferase [Nannizzia gypsea CBS 118893]|uniref:Sterigmatocystin 8-O-methyltransferase n=1 Tax=Arthroderma gypseum (strain ATCC MYA-4604 / CBS 118893) TaxID=535722 RepID=E5R1P5_ARTGP|nr:sterigmatocystin 8-O-methyltransferase [Nannizzia gypsea CBS 118893]EFQ97743.1 sterigmatocystin 8-O-methyltransferase [Nannizzia gypsea CBS 118893]
MGSNGVTTNGEPAALIARLQRLASRLSDGSDQEARRECLQLSRALTAQLEQPENIAVDMAFSPMVASTVRIAVDLNLFSHIVKNEPVTSAKLAELSGADEHLIVRVLRPLTTHHFVEELSPKTWKASRITHAMTIDGIASGHRLLSQLVVPAIQSAPEYMQEKGYSCPSDPKNGLVQYAFKTEKSAFERISSIPSLLKDFNTFMGSTMGARTYWIDWYPVKSRLLDGASPDKALLVDVGAGKGHDLLAYKEKFPNTGRLVLEDLPAVTNAIEGLDSAIEKISYDFFTEQPIIGARAYFYHHILHDWSDEQCLKILARVASAMTPGYSKLLLHEMIIPEVGASHFQAMLDMTMMAFNGGMERTKQQWTALLGKAGLKVVQFWDPAEEGGDGIVEAMKA